MRLSCARLVLSARVAGVGFRKQTTEVDVCRPPFKEGPQWDQAAKGYKHGLLMVSPGDFWPALMPDVAPVTAVIAEIHENLSVAAA